MANDFFSQSPNFINPDYSTPEQRAQQYAYAKFLTENQVPITGGRTGWAQGLQNLTSQLMGGIEARRADQGQLRGRQMDIANILQNMNPQQPQGQPQGSIPPQGGVSVPSSAADLGKGLLDRGFNQPQSAALVGNMMQESNLNPSSLNKNEGAYGLINWRLDRRQALEKFAADQGKPASDPNVQMDFLKNEMQGPEAKNSAKFLASNDVPSANAALQQYIRYGDNSGATRLANANAVAPQLASLGNGVPQPQQPPQPPANGPQVDQNQPPPIQAPPGPQQPFTGNMGGNNPALIGALLGAQNLDPRVTGAMMGQALEKPKFTTIGHDIFGQPKYGFVNENNQTITAPKEVGGQQPQGGTQQGRISPDEQGQVENAMKSGATGDEFIKQLPGPTANNVQMMIDGRMPLPSGFALKSPYWQQMLTLANQADKGFDATVWAGRQQTQKSFSPGGQNRKIMTSLDQFASHLEGLDKGLDQLSNTNFPAVNQVKNAALEQGGNKAKQEALANVRTFKNAVAREAESVMRGTAGSVEGVRQFAKDLDENGSYTGQKTTQKALVDLMLARVQAQGKAYQDGMKIPEEKRIDPMEQGLQMLAPKTQQVFRKFLGESSLQGVTGAAPSQPQGVQKWIRKPDGSLGPAQ